MTTVEFKNVQHLFDGFDFPFLFGVAFWLSTSPFSVSGRDQLQSILGISRKELRNTLPSKAITGFPDECAVH